MRQVHPNHNILIFRISKLMYIPPIPSHFRGAFATSQARGGVRWTRKLRLTSAIRADGQNVWSWHLDAGVKFAEGKSFRK